MDNLDLKLNSTYFSTISELQNNEYFNNHIELNILSNTEKICSLNCGYCKLGENIVKINSIKNIPLNMPIRIISDLEKIKDNLILQGIKLDNLIVSGNGEPGLHPQFKEISNAIKNWVDANSSDTRIILFTNGSNFNTKKNIGNLNYYDEIFLKLDCFDDITFKKLNNPIIRTNVDNLIHIAQKIDKLSIQSLFVNGKASNTSERHIEEYLEVISMLKPRRVLIETVDQDINGFTPCTDIFLYNLSNKIKKRLEIEIIVNI